MTSASNARARAIGTLEEREIFTLYRRRNGITQVQVARAVGISQPYLSTYEKGRVQLSQARVDLLWQAAEQIVVAGEVGKDDAEDESGAA